MLDSNLSACHCVYVVRTVAPTGWPDEDDKAHRSLTPGAAIAAHVSLDSGVPQERTEAVMVPGDVQIVEYGPDFTTVWHCDPPPNGTAYRITRVTWETHLDATDFRHIWSWSPT